MDKNPRSTSIHPWSVCILAVVHRPAYFSSFSSSPPPLVTLAPSLTSFTSRWRKRRRASIVHHPPHACMHACTRARAWLREPYNFYGDIIWSTLFANRPLARLVTPVIAIIDSLNRARGSDGHLLRPPVYQSRTSIRNDSILSFFVPSSLVFFQLLSSRNRTRENYHPILSFFLFSLAIKLKLRFKISWKLLRHVLFRNRNSI